MPSRVRRVCALAGGLAGVALVTAGVALAAPASTASPRIEGKPNYLQRLACLPGSWSGDPVRFAYAWTSGDVIGGEQVGDAQTLRVPAKAINYPLTCTVTAYDASGASSSATSPAVTVRPGLVTIRITRIRGRHGKVTISGVVGPKASIASRYQRGYVTINLPAGSNGLQQLSSVIPVKGNGRFSGTGAQATGRHRFVVEYTPGNSLFGQRSVRTRLVRVPR